MEVVMAKRSHKSYVEAGKKGARVRWKGHKKKRKSRKK
jgi:hypothetical protein